MSDRNTHGIGRPSLAESAASCWGLLGGSLTWHPEPLELDRERGQDRDSGEVVNVNGDESDTDHHIIDVAEAERQTNGSSVPPRER